MHAHQAHKYLIKCMKAVILLRLPRLPEDSQAFRGLLSFDFLKQVT